MASSFHLGLSRPSQKQRMIVMGAKVPPTLTKKVNHFFIGYNKTIGVRSGPGFFKTKIKKI